jgi:hypothetical protein
LETSPKHTQRFESGVLFQVLLSLPLSYRRKQASTNAGSGNGWHNKAGMGVLRLLPGNGDDENDARYRLPKATAELLANESNVSLPW